MKENKKNLFCGIFGLLISCAFYYFSLQIKITSLYGNKQLDSRLFPQIWAVSLALVSLYLFFVGLSEYLRKRTPTTGELEKKQREYKKDVAPVLLTFILLFLYVFLLRKIGFILMSLFYVYCQILVLTPSERRNYWKPAVVSLVSVAVIYCVFTMMLHMILPKGIFYLL